MVTMKEIAQMAGVSRGTVDRVLNHRGAVSEETARRVQEIADSMGYQPNRAGIALAAQKRKLRIGVAVFGSGNPFFDIVLEGVREKAAELAGYDVSVLIRRTAYDADAQLRAIDELVAEGIHGLVLTPYADESVVEKINELDEKGIPTVTTNTDIMGSHRLCYVGSDYFAGGRCAAGLMRLATGGSARLGIVTGSSQVLCHTERIAGFMSELAHLPGLQVLDTQKNHDDEFESYEVTRYLLRTYPEMNALFFSAAGLSGGCRAVINSNRTKNMKIICFDAEHVIPELLESGLVTATISQQPLRQGSDPLGLLFDYLTTGIRPQEIHYVESAILIRESLHR